MNLLLISILITLVYFLAGLRKVMNFRGTVMGFHKKMGMFPMWLSTLIIVGVVLLEIFAPLVIVYGSQDRSIKDQVLMAIMGLIIFTILTIVFYHMPPYGSKYFSFMTHLSMLGGLMALGYIYQNQ